MLIPTQSVENGNRCIEWKPINISETINASVDACAAPPPPPPCNLRRVGGKRSLQLLRGKFVYLPALYRSHNTISSSRLYLDQINDEWTQPIPIKCHNRYCLIVNTPLSYYIYKRSISTEMFRITFREYRFVSRSLVAHSLSNVARATQRF